MNERIKELQEQCWESRQYGPPWFNYKKFAELIVRECAEVLRKEMDRLDELNRVVAAQTLDTAQVLIKNHFGVE